MIYDTAQLTKYKYMLRADFDDDYSLVKGELVNSKLQKSLDFSDYIDKLSPQSIQDFLYAKGVCVSITEAWIVLTSLYIDVYSDLEGFSEEFSKYKECVQEKLNDC